MEFIKAEEIKEMANPGVVSRQLLNPDNSSSERVTITADSFRLCVCEEISGHRTG